MKKILFVILILISISPLFSEPEQPTATRLDAVAVKTDYYDKVEEVGPDNLYLVLGALTNKVQLLSRRAKKAFEKGDYENAIVNWLNAKEIIINCKKKGAIKRLKDGVLQLDQVFLDSNKNEVYFYAKVPTLVEGEDPNNPSSDMDPMPFEVVVANPHGRVHETVFITEARPFHLHTLLVMLGFENGQVKGSKTAKDAKIGDILDIFVEYKTMPGELKQCHIEDMLFDKSSHKTLPAVGWFFNGPEIKDNRYVPDFTGELILDMMGDNVLITTQEKLWNSQMEVVWKPKFDIDKRKRVRIIVRARKKK